MKLTFENKLHACIKGSSFKRFFLLSSILLAALFSTAQSIYPSTINITGQFGTFKDFQFEISIGESTSITTLSNSLVSVTSGVLQTSVIYQPPVNMAASLSEEIKLYPNPARDFVGVNFISKSVGVNQYELFDLQGKKIMSKRFYHFGAPRTEKLDVHMLLPGTYILSVQQYSTVTNEIVKRGSFKIIKTN
jgi:hypothetical protein